MSSTQAIENLIDGYATSEDSSFLIPNATEDFFSFNAKWESNLCVGIRVNV